jgi:hypothetical protein
MTSITRPDRGCLPFLWQWAPLTQRHIKRGTRWGTGTNVHHVHSAPINPSLRTDHKGVEAGGKPSVAAATVLHTVAVTTSTCIHGILVALHSR